MDKVDSRKDFSNLQNQTTFLNPQAMTEARKSQQSKKTKGLNFAKVMEKSILEMDELGPLRNIEPSEEALQELIDDVYSAGDDLKHRPVAEEFLRYKQAVRNFINYVVKNGYECDTVSGKKIKVTAPDGKTEWKGPFGKVKITIIDTKLNQLAEDILLKHIKELDLGRRVDEITGLLVDLTITGKIRERNE